MIMSHVFRFTTMVLTASSVVAIIWILFLMIVHFFSPFSTRSIKIRFMIHAEGFMTYDYHVTALAFLSIQWSSTDSYP